MKPPEEERVDAVVIGTGFGGSVAAWRLAEAGLSLVILERGNLYPPGSFPRSPHLMARNFWCPDQGLFGLFEVLYQVPEGVTRLGLTGLRQVMSIGLRDWAHRF